MTQRLICTLAVVLSLGFPLESTYVTLTSEEVWQNEQFRMVCRFSKEIEDKFSRWKVSLSPDEIIIKKEGTNCKIHGLFNSSQYDVDCSVRQEFSVSVKQATLQQNNSIWQCRHGNNQSNILQIEVNAQIRTLNLTYHKSTVTGETTIDIEEFSAFKARCTSSFGRPLPNITWYKYSSGNATPNTITIEYATISSTLNYNISRYDNNTRTGCVASNRRNFTVASGNVTMNVLYPPDGPTILGYTKEHTYKVILEHTGKLTCNVSGGNPTNVNLTWSCFNRKEYVNHESKNISTITWTALDIQDGICTCKAVHTTGTKNASVNVAVLYSPRKPRITLAQHNVSRIIRVVLNSSLSLHCSALSQPMANISWNLPNKTVTKGYVVHMHNIQMSMKGNITCLARNEMRASDGYSKNGSNSTSVEIQILFPPTNPEFKYASSSGKPIVTKRLRILKGNNLTVACVSHGNPSPYYHWLGEKTNSSLLIAYNVSKDFNKTCNASNVMIETSGVTHTGSSTATLSVSVLYPPSFPHLTLQYGNVNMVIESSSTLHFIENTSFTVYCQTTSSPSANYTWDGQIQQPSAKLNLQDVKRKHNGVYTCHATNHMQPSFGNIVPGYNNASIRIDILYPPGIDEMENGSAVEGSTFSTSCPVLPGNPSNQSLQWEREGNYSLTNAQILSIQNVSRYDEMLYTCVVHYSMKPTGDIDVVGAVSKRFYLTVFYRAVITNFTTVGHQTDAVIVNKSDTLRLLCVVDSNPDSHLSIKFDKIIVQQAAASKHLIYNKTKADCSDAGVYTCIGGNNYNNGYMARANLIVFVKCKPRPSLTLRPTRTIRTALNMSATLTFTAASYLDTDETSFMWMKQDGRNWIQLKNNSNTEILTIGLQSSLTIINSAHTDFGEYLLQYNNSVGSSNFTFNLLLAESDAQTDFENENQLSITGPIVGVVISLIVIVVLLLFIWRYRKGLKKPNGSIYQNVQVNDMNRRKRLKTKNLQSEETILEELQEVDDAPNVTIEPTEYYNSPETIAKIERIKISELFSYVLGKTIDSFGTDYQKLPTDLQKPCIFARKPENIALNRYNGIYPYDHSRVKLPGFQEFFINACYIDGYERSNVYIASLGPTDKTTSGFKTFWQMIWYERSDIIVMLTNLREPSGMKCEQYWPETGTMESYGDVSVSNNKTEEFAEYTVRYFTLENDKERRTLSQLHFTAWPDKKVPEDASSLLEFRNRMKTTPTCSQGPIVVHCSAGIGRTGTLIALDRLIKEGQCEGSVNVFECVKSMREQRVKMVQTLEQYIYIYKALVNALAFDSETIPVESFQEYVDTTNNNTYSRQFQQLRQSVESESKEDMDAVILNERLTKKNRTGADIPDHFRIFLYMNKEDGDCDYINAVYMNSFKNKDYFITAQSPMTNTVGDFICMMYQENCTCIVTMEDLQNPGMTVGVYLPSDKHTLTFDKFTVSCTTLEKKQHYIVRKVVIKFTGKYDSGEKTLYHFQYTKWMKESDTPVNAEEFVQFVNEVAEYASQFFEERSHVLVHCLKANERSGLFCAVTTLMEKLKYERQINVLNTLRRLRTRRKTAITSMEQLKFCYKAACVYIEMYRP